MYKIGYRESSYLFVPALRPEYVDKGFHKGASAIIFDLEDSITSEQKDAAREAAIAYDKKNDRRNIWLRINAADTEDYKKDLEVARELKNFVGVVVPKVEQREDVEYVYQLLEKPILPMLESAKSLISIEKIASAKGVARLTYGRLDLANDMGTDPKSVEADILFDHVRLQLMIHSSANNLAPPLDTIYPDFKDEAGMRKYIRRWAHLGFDGMLCIHPKQCEWIDEELEPSEAEITFATRVMQEYERRKSAAFQIDGYMVDTPVIKRSQKILARVGGNAKEGSKELLKQD